MVTPHTLTSIELTQALTEGLLVDQWSQLLVVSTDSRQALRKSCYNHNCEYNMLRQDEKYKVFVVWHNRQAFSNGLLVAPKMQSWPQMAGNESVTIGVTETRERDRMQG